MAEPVGRDLRAAHGSGLTSPEPVSTPTATAATQNPDPSQEPRTSRTAGKRQHARARNQPAKLPVQESSPKRATGISRWIEAKRFPFGWVEGSPEIHRGKAGCWNSRSLMLVVTPPLALSPGPSYFDFALEHQATNGER
jgi:hypothetical protein